jgi:hypothetical protein
VAADSYHFDEEPDPGLHKNEKRIRIRINVNGWSQIRIEVMRIRKPACQPVTVSIPFGAIQNTLL